MTKKSCRRTMDENKIHEKAVKMRKKTDEQLVHYVEDRVSAEPERMVIYITWRKDGGFSCTANARNVGEN